MTPSRPKGSSRYRPRRASRRLRSLEGDSDGSTHRDRPVPRTDARRAGVIVYAIIDLRSPLDHPLGNAVEVFTDREDAVDFITEVRSDDPELARNLLIEERELEAGERAEPNYRLNGKPR
jgi:hypothetical protein